MNTKNIDPQEISELRKLAEQQEGQVKLLASVVLKLVEKVSEIEKKPAGLR